MFNDPSFKINCSMAVVTVIRHLRCIAPWWVEVVLNYPFNIYCSMAYVIYDFVIRLRHKVP